MRTARPDHAHPARRRCDGDSYSDRPTACHEYDTCAYHERGVRLYVSKRRFTALGRGPRCAAQLGDPWVTSGAKGGSAASL
jgi:hypothetical protein